MRKLPQLIEGDIRVEWVDLGEGREGDFDPADPEDEPLLRFDVSFLEDGEWADPGNASYCTRMRADAPEKILTAALQVLMTAVQDTRNAGKMKRRLQELSWLRREDFDNL